MQENTKTTKVNVTESKDDTISTKYIGNNLKQHVKRASVLGDRLC